MNQAQTSLALQPGQQSLGQLLRAKYNNDTGYLVTEEVSDVPGHGASRRIDFVVAGLWQSTGYELQAFEQKVSRGDWLRELKDLSKADAIIKHADRFWLLAEPNVAAKEEVPANWGMMVRKGDKRAA